MVKKEYPYTGGITCRWPTCIIDQIEDLGDIQDELSELAVNLKTVGNLVLSERIIEIAVKISNSRENLKQSIQLKADVDAKRLIMLEKSTGNDIISSEVTKMNLNK